MTDVLGPNLDFMEVQEMTVLSGFMPPDANGTSHPHLFLSIKVATSVGGDLIEALYGMTPWEAMKLGVGLGNMAIEVVERQGNDTTPPPPAPPKRERSPYL